VGKNKFAVVKPCARCLLTTVNQDTAEKGVEPLATLSKYRKQDNKVLFGQNLIAIDHGEIHEGDEIVLG
ncbi:MAG TPA: MOSC domain-containing protein, partial [Cyclobacteriaceae bacterium]|nr:MOSC domain-containing protein [Cyclobacteriaceae bacterium]